MENNSSPYRLGKVAIAFVVILAALSATPAILNGSIGLGIGSFVSTLIGALIAISIIKFVFVAGKRTLLQDRTEDVEQTS